jgi:lysozyme
MRFNREKTIKLAVNLIARLENFRSKAYLDDGLIPTIGYGTTRISGHPVQIWMTCTRKQAENWLMDYLLLDCVLLMKWCENEKVTLDDNQAATILSFTYNASFRAFIGSSMAREIKEGDFDSAATAFLKWNKIRIDGKLKFSPGLFNRRMEEERCFIDEATC